ncbi:hypothetical protein WP1_107 [Pseudomonas phage WP1]
MMNDSPGPTLSWSRPADPSPDRRNPGSRRQHCQDHRDEASQSR